MSAAGVSADPSLQICGAYFGRERGVLATGGRETGFRGAKTGADATAGGPQSPESAHSGAAAAPMAPMSIRGDVSDRQSPCPRCRDRRPGRNVGQARADRQRVAENQAAKRAARQEDCRTNSSIARERRELTEPLLNCTENGSDGKRWYAKTLATSMQKPMAVDSVITWANTHPAPDLLSATPTI